MSATGALLLAACGAPPAAAAAPAAVSVSVPSTAESPGADAAAESGRYRCTVEVRPLGPVRTGEASDERPQGLAEQAEREACRKLWEAERVDCHDEGKVVTISRQTSLSVVDGRATHSIRVLMRSVGPLREAAGSADHSASEACHRAVDEACRGAPDGTECSSRGLYCAASPEDGTRWHCAPTPPQARRRAPSPFEV